MVWVSTREADCDVTVIRIVQMEGHGFIRFVRRQLFSCMRFIKRKLPDHMKFYMVATDDLDYVTYLETAFGFFTSPVDLPVALLVRKRGNFGFCDCLSVAVVCTPSLAISTISATDTDRDFYYIETMPEVFLDVFILNQRLNPLLSIIYAPVEAFYVAKYIEPRISRIIPQTHIAAGQTIYNVFIWLILVVWPVAFYWQ